MSLKRFSNQTAKQVISQLESHLDCERFNLKVDSFAKIVEVRPAKGGKKGPSKKRKKLKEEMKDMPKKKRRKVLSQKRREKPKLKHVRNGRMVNLKGYSGY